MQSLRIAAIAGRDLCAIIGALSLISFYAVERSPLWLVPATLVLAALSFCLFRIEAWHLDRTPAGAGRGRARFAHQRMTVAVPAPTNSEATREDVTSALIGLGYSPAASRKAALEAARSGERSFDRMFQAAQARLA